MLGTMRPKGRSHCTWVSTPTPRSAHAPRARAPCKSMLTKHSPRSPRALAPATSHLLLHAMLSDARGQPHRQELAGASRLRVPPLHMQPPWPMRQRPPSLPLPGGAREGLHAACGNGFAGAGSNGRDHRGGRVVSLAAMRCERRSPHSPRAAGRVGTDKHMRHR